MPNYIVTRKSDGAELLRYTAAEAQEVNGYGLVDYDHTPFDPEAPAQVTTGRVMTKLEYLRRFTTEERVAIRQVATQNAVLADYLLLMEMAEQVDTGDPDTIAAVAMLEQAGLLATGRADEVLNG